jgi:hypothetical protein
MYSYTTREYQKPKTKHKLVHVQVELICVLGILGDWKLGKKQKPLIINSTVNNALFCFWSRRNGHATKKNKKQKAKNRSMEKLEPKMGNRMLRPR